MSNKVETLEQFRKSARVMIISDNDDEIFHKDAVAAIQYCEYMYIEILKDGQFYLSIVNEEYTTRKLKQLERILWFDFAIDELLQNDPAIRPQLIKQTKFNNKRDFAAWKNKVVIYNHNTKKYCIKDVDGWFKHKELKQYFYENFVR